jgi:hypothetical protein
MRAKVILTCLLLSQSVLVLPISAGASSRTEPPVIPDTKTSVSASLEKSARLAISENVTESAPAIAALRTQGPMGLDVLFQVYADEISSHLAGQSTARVSDPRWVRLTSALDAVAQQRDSFASRLYWYTDFEQAKAEAKASGKPILSLRLLGNLTEEFSCANSRFFRAVLYPNAEVSAVLRERFILHWKSVRPAPRITIDFGDGRKLERTITGNSIHYVLDGEGRPIDAIPGLYGPKAFLGELTDAERAFHLITSRTEADREGLLWRFHANAKLAIATQWQTDILRTGVNMIPDASVAEGDGSPKPAQSAAPVAVSKATLEIKTVRSIGLNGGAPGAASPETEASAWARIAALHDGDVKLDAASLAVMRSQYQASPITDEAFSRMVKNLERNLALDSVRNRYLIHNRIHQWFADGTAKQDVDALNEQVYAKLFLTPGSDPWMGLVTPDTYSGLVDDGLIER